MYRRSIPHEEQLGRDLSQEVLQEADPTSGLFKERSSAPSLATCPPGWDGADHLKRWSRLLGALMQDGPLAHRSVGRHYRRQKVEARLIHKHNRRALLYGLLLSSGQRCSFQRLMWPPRLAEIGPTQRFFCKESPKALTSLL